MRYFCEHIHFILENIFFVVSHKIPLFFMLWRSFLRFTGSCKIQTPDVKRIVKWFVIDSVLQMAEPKYHLPKKKKNSSRSRNWGNSHFIWFYLWGQDIGFLENKTKTHITYGGPRRIRCISNVLKRRLSSCHWNFKLYARDHAIVHLLYCFICWIHFLERNKSAAKFF